MARRRKKRKRTGTRRGRRNALRKSLTVGRACGSSCGAANRRRTTGKGRGRGRGRKRKRKRPRARRRMRAQLLCLRTRQWPPPLHRHTQRRQLRRSPRCLHSPTPRRPYPAQARYGVVVAHASATTSSGSPQRIAPRRLAKWTTRLPRLAH
jgi:hypothetical protein